MRCLMNVVGCVWRVVCGLLLVGSCVWCVVRGVLEVVC